MKIYAYKYEEIDAQTEAVKAQAQKVQDKLHALMICALAEWAKKPTLGIEVAGKLTAIQNASPYHAKHVADWIALKTGLNWSEEKETWYAHVDQKFTKDKLDAAKNEPFWKVSPPVKAKPLTDEAIVKMLEGILAKQKSHEKKPVEGDSFSKAGNEALRQAIEAWKASA